METNLKSSTNRPALILIGLLAVVLVAASSYLPPGIDWRDTYRPAARALLSGQSPFSVGIFFAAPWSLIPLLPMALLPLNIGRALFLLVSVLAFAFVAYRLGAKPIALVAFLLSPPVIHCLLNANIEWLPLLGFVLPPQIGLVFIAIKPQIGVALFWAAEAWRDGGIRRVARLLWPITLLMLFSFVLFGFWPLRFLGNPDLVRTYNASLWPSSIPVGLALLIASIRRREIRFAMGASPCLSPVVLFHAWSGALAAVVASTAELVAAVLGLWALFIIRALTGGGVGSIQRELAGRFPMKRSERRGQRPARLTSLC